MLAARAQLGSVIGPSLSDVAPTMLFFSGGAGSVRGHEYESLGIPVGTNSAGGRGYLALSGEIRDIALLTTRQNKELVVFGKNNDRLQVFEKMMN